METIKKIKALMIGLLAGTVSLLHAQTFTASASSTTVGVGQQFEVTFSINANASNFRPPSFEGFSVYSGPNQQSSVEIINGNMTESTSISFTVAALAEGTYTISPATINTGGKTLSSNSIAIKVVKGNAPAGNQAASNGSPQGGNNPQSPVELPEGNKNIFIKMTMSKQKVYVGEQVVLTAKLYTRINLESVSQESAPDYTGFYSQDVPPATKGQLAQSRENINGVNYIVAILSQTVLTPQRAGKLEIDPLSIDVIADEPVKSNNLIDQFFGPSYKRVEYTIKSDKASIDVVPLPKTNEAFSGAVGEFSLNGGLNRNQVNANDAINLTITVSGNGDLKLIDSIPVKFPPDFDHYDPKITDHFTVSGSGESCSRTFNYLIIPRHAGNFNIPQINFNYFNPQEKKYINASIPGMNIEVAKGANNQPSVTVPTSANKEEVKLLSSDIRYIHLNYGTIYSNNSYFLYSFPFYAGIFSPILIFAAFVFVRRRYVEQRKDVVGMKMRGATKMAKKRLANAYKLMSANKKDAFYEELLNALNGYLSNKFTIPVADLSRETISATLSEKNVKPETLQNLIKALDNCEYARYAPQTVISEQLIHDDYIFTLNLITGLEDEIA